MAKNNKKRGGSKPSDEQAALNKIAKEKKFEVVDKTPKEPKAAEVKEEVKEEVTPVIDIETLDEIIDVDAVKEPCPIIPTVDVVPLTEKINVPANKEINHTDKTILAIVGKKLENVGVQLDTYVKYIASLNGIITSGDKENLNIAMMKEVSELHNSLLLLGFTQVIGNVVPTKYIVKNSDVENFMQEAASFGAIFNQVALEADNTPENQTILEFKGFADEGKEKIETVKEAVNRRNVIIEDASLWENDTVAKEQLRLIGDQCNKNFIPERLIALVGDFFKYKKKDAEWFKKNEKADTSVILEQMLAFMDKHPILIVSLGRTLMSNLIRLEHAIVAHTILKQGLARVETDDKKISDITKVLIKWIHDYSKNDVTVKQREWKEIEGLLSCNKLTNDSIYVYTAAVTPTAKEIYGRIRTAYGCDVLGDEFITIKDPKGVESQIRNPMYRVNIANTLFDIRHCYNDKLKKVVCDGSNQFAISINNAIKRGVSMRVVKS